MWTKVGEDVISNWKKGGEKSNKDKQQSVTVFKGSCFGGGATSVFRFHHDPVKQTNAHLSPEHIHSEVGVALTSIC